MEEQTSVSGTLNKREIIKGFSLALIGALIGLLWTGINPVVLSFTQTKVFDLTPFFTFVNWETVMFTAFVAGAPYFGYTIQSGEKK